MKKTLKNLSAEEKLALARKLRAKLEQQLSEAPADQPRDAGRDAADAAAAAAEPVAIIGMACRLPGDVKDPGGFWKLLASGQDGISVVPADRWDADAFYDADPNAPGKMN